MPILLITCYLTKLWIVIFLATLLIVSSKVCVFPEKKQFTASIFEYFVLISPRKSEHLELGKNTRRLMNGCFAMYGFEMELPNCLCNKDKNQSVSS